MGLDRQASEAAERCFNCPKMCTASCPVEQASGQEKLSPWGKMSLVSLTVPAAPQPLGLPGPIERLAARARRVLEPAAREALDADTAEAFYGCTGCGRCTVACEHGNDVTHALYLARGVAVEQGVAPAAARAAADRFARQGHAQEPALADALGALARAHPPRPGTTSVLFAGCEAPLQAPESIGAVLRVAARLGAPLGVASEPLCCGRPLFEGGFRQEFRQHVREAWTRLGEREVVTPSAACARALTRWAREVGVEPRGPVTHTTTYLARRLGPHVQAVPLPGPVTYHDPCHLGRGLGEYEAPRRLLEAAVRGGVTEAATHRERSTCCGASGLVPGTFPQLARSMAMTRADELRESAGAGMVATACPSCLTALGAAGLRVVDVAQVVEAWLDGRGAVQG